MPEVELICANCGAGNKPPATVCWLCKKNFRVPPVVSDVARQNQDSTLTFSIASVLLVTTLCAVFFSILSMAPGLAILLAMLSVPALVRTGLAVQRRSQLGKPVPLIHKVLWFLSSLTVTTILAVVVLIASVGTFCAVCLSANSPNAVPVALLAAGMGAIGVLAAGWHWIAYRWRRDVDV